MQHRFYTGSYARTGEESITLCSLDTGSGQIRKEWAFNGTDYPSFVLPHPEGRVLYAVRELTEEGALNVFRINDDLDKRCPLKYAGTWMTLGQDPCYLALNEDLQFLAVINYTGSSFTLFSLDMEGIPVKMTAHVEHHGSGPRADRQEKAHPHCCRFTGDRMFVTDLGMDTLFCYRLDRDNGNVSEEFRLGFPAGAGPRHICASKEHQDVLYINGELSSRVYTVKILNNTAQIIGETSTLPEDFQGENITAAIRLSEDEKYLFVSNRGDDSICAFRIGEDCLPIRADIVRTGGCWPRDFDIFGDTLLIANEKSNSITSLHFDRNTCKLIPDDAHLDLIRPTCVMKEVR